MDLVLAHPSGGRLWQGGFCDLEPRFLRSRGIGAVALMAAEVQPRSLGGIDLLHAPLLDREDLDPSSVLAAAGAAADRVARRVARGMGVLSSCAAGLNRSGLCSALAVAKLTGASGAAAVAAVRRARGAGALGNRLFERLAREFGAALPRTRGPRYVLEP